jgi:hypothetical protein
MKFFNSREYGQTLIEAIVAAPLVIAASSLFIVLIYGIIVSMISHHCLYEMLICQQSVPLPTDCKVRAEASLSQTLIAGKLLRLDSSEDTREAKAQVEILLPFQFQLLVHESLQLPLQADRT